MENFEERLYQHWIYTYNLKNLVGDLVWDLKDLGFFCTEEKYKTGQYYTVTVNNFDETFEEVLEFLIQEYDPEYYGSLGYYIELNTVNFYIII